MVLFGTGQYLNANDKIDFRVQTFYGIWDDGGRVYDGDVLPTRGDLLEQQFEATAFVEEAGGGAAVSLGRSSTNTAIDWSGSDAGPGDRGWYIDLKLQGGVAEGERVVVAPQLRGSRVVFVSMIPADCCSSGGLSWINALDFKDGSRLAYTPFDYNLDGGFGADDKLSIVDDAGDTSQVVGSSIRILTDGGTGVYSAPSQLGLGGGQMQSIVSDSEGDLILLRESTALEWRNWVQLQ
jgi:type IV pilus assembly protein PilY1